MESVKVAINPNTSLQGREGAIRKWQFPFYWEMPWLGEDKIEDEALEQSEG